MDSLTEVERFLIWKSSFNYISYTEYEYQIIFIVLPRACFYIYNYLLFMTVNAIDSYPSPDRSARYTYCNQPAHMPYLYSLAGSSQGIL